MKYLIYRLFTGSRFFLFNSKFYVPIHLQMKSWVCNLIKSYSIIRICILNLNNTFGRNFRLISEKERKNILGDLKSLQVENRNLFFLPET